MNILQVVEATGAGVGRHVRGLCQDLIAQGQQVTVAYAPHRIDETFKRFVVDRRNEVHFVPVDIRRDVSPPSDLLAVVRLLHLIKHEGQFDVIHGHSSKGGAVARIAGRWSGIPTVYTVHGLIMTSPEISRVETATYTLIERTLGRWATSKFIAVSQDECAFAIKHRLVSSDRIVVIPNAIECRDFEYVSEDAIDEDISSKPLTFGSTMRLEPQKAPGDLVKAFVRLCSMLPQFPMQLVIAGEGKLADEVTKQIEASGLSEKISLLGWKADIREVLREFDVFVVSSLYEAGLSYSTMEAMVESLPIISTNVFGAQEALSHVPGNIVIPTGNSDALAQGMKRLATLADRRSLRQSLRKVGEANRDYVCKYFSQGEITRRTLEIYQEVRDKRRELPR
jgi:glycosyltransferase involved in cell wall biosynthesis